VSYVLRRLLHAALLLVGVSLLTFAFSELAPGDYYTQMRAAPTIAPETVEALRHKAGYDRPLPVRYAAWATSVIRGDFGYSLAYAGPVAPLVRERLGATLLLAGSATFAAWLLAIPLGLWNATRRGWQDAAARVAMALLLIVPDLLLAIVLLLLAVETGWFPAGGMASPDAASLPAWRRLLDLLRHLCLPAAVLTIGMLPVLVRHVRAAVLEVMDAPFALSARAQGIPPLRLLYRHLLPAAVNPLVSLFGLSIGTLLSASLLVEVVMGWPGLGPLLIEAIMARDVAIVLAVVMLSATFLILGNLAADLLLYRLDPRIRVRG
jgi:peptide/nickel transport system permease protein